MYILDMKRAPLSLALALFATLAITGTGQAATPRANLAAKSLTATPTTLAAGATITASVKVSNGGAANARKTKTFFILSADDRRSGDDLRLASISTARLKTAKSKIVKFVGVIPTATPAGNRFVLACADGTRTVREKSERDNCKSASITITAPIGSTPTPPAPTGPTGPPNLPIDTDADGIIDDTDNCVATVNPDQADNDNDGKGDVCDECPSFSNPGGAFCVATVPDVKTGVNPEGQNVSIQGLIVTAVAGTRVWAQASLAAAPNEGIELVYSSPPVLAIGNVITVGGQIVAGGKLQISTSLLTSSGSGAPTPLTVSGATLSAPQYDSLLVRVNNVTKVSAYNTTNWLVTDGTQFAVLNTVIGTLPSYDDATSFNKIVGIKSNDANYQTLLPRSNADIEQTA